LHSRYGLTSPDWGIAGNILQTECFAPARETPSLLFVAFSYVQLLWRSVGAIKTSSGVINSLNASLGASEGLRASRPIWRQANSGVTTSGSAAYLHDKLIGELDNPACGD
jgi:hypothetical protein